MCRWHGTASDIDKGEIWWAIGGCPLERFTHTTTLLPDKGKGKRSQQRKRPTYNTPARVLYVGECRNLLKYVILGYITIILIFSRRQALFENFL